MPDLSKSAERIEVKTRLTHDLHQRMLGECFHCGCHISGFVAVAIAHEIARRKVARGQATEASILVGQMLLEGTEDAKDNT